MKRHDHPCRAASAAYHAELTSVRRDLHAHPELAFEESRTSALVVESLKKLGHRDAHAASPRPAWSA